MRKILVVITTNFVSWGGLTTAYMNYYRVLDKSKLLIDFASMNKVEPGLEKEVNENGGQYYQLSDKRQTPIKYLIDLNRLLRHKNYDVIHVHGNSATMAAELFLSLLCGIPVRIVHCHNTQPKYRRLSKLLCPVFNRMYTQAVAVSFEAGSWLYKKNPFIILNNAIDIKKYSFDFNKRMAARNKLELDNDVLVVGHVGKINYQKNHTFIVKIFSELVKMKENSCLLLIGDGELREEIEKQVEEYGLTNKVVFVGMSNEPEFWLNAMDCFLFPSHFEGFGLALAEAQANGLACFASDVIPDKTNATGTVHFMSLDDNAKKWAECIMLSDISRMDNNYIKEKFYQTGLDISMEANKLKELYLF